MKNIYIRSGMSPLDSFSATQILLNNSIGTNVGNLLYVYGILRTITKEDTTITANYYKVEVDKAEEINEKYDCFIIPLADAFREDFVGELRALTRLVKKLKIPCFIIGAGLRAPYEADLKAGFSFDEDVKNFVSAVLEKSAMVGVRGQITAEYLSHLGFREGIDHIAIGCPSMYSFGPELKIRDTNITTDSIVCYNSSLTTPDNIHEFIDRTIREFPNYQFVPQVLKELRLIYTGVPFKSKNPLYPSKITDEVYNGEHARFFINVPTWLNFMKKADLSFGSRLHGNIAATLAGTPSILFPKDSRVRELADYHHLTSVPYDQVDENTNIWDLIEKVDFHQVSKYQKENFDRFIGFLEKNGIDHIYENGIVPEVNPLGAKMEKIQIRRPVKSIAVCNLEQMHRRFNRFYPRYERKIKEMEKEYKKLKSENSQLKKENSQLKAVQNPPKVSTMAKVKRKVKKMIGK